MDHPVIQELNENDIERALSEDLFFLEYQPQVSFSHQHEILGAEAFLRMKHPVYGVMMPSSFFPLICSMDLMLKITCLVLHKVSLDWLKWNESGSDINISVNVDASILSQVNLAQEFGVILSEQHIPKRRITLEFSNCWSKCRFSDEWLKSLIGLRLKGFRISMDDFSFESLDEAFFEKLPLDEIKIDRKVSSSLIEIDSHKKIARNGLYIANRFGLRIVTAGVEDTSTAEWFKNMGFDIGQGYYFGRPLVQQEFYQQYISSGQLIVADYAKPTLLLLEDDVHFQDLLAESLSEFYNIKLASSIQEAKEIIKNCTPNIVICDVYLPDGTGIDFCKNDLKIDDMSPTNIIFISGAKEFENKLNAYEVGGSDYIEKPFSVIELLAKIRRLTNYQSRRQELVNSAAEANQMVMRSMIETAYYGEIVQFLKRLMKCNDEPQIAKELFGFMAGKSLLTSMEFRDGSSMTHFDQFATACSPIELNVFDLLRAKGRLYPFGQRLMVNDTHVSLLVKNMPADDEEQGKIRDYVAVLIEGMESRYKEILRQRVLVNVTNRLEKLASKLLKIVDQDAKNKNALLDKYSFELQMSFHSLDLSEEQEQHISSIVDEMIKSKDIEENNASALNQDVIKMLDIMKKSLAGLDSQSDIHSSNDIDNSTVDLF